MSSFSVFKALVVLSILGFLSVSIEAQSPAYRYHFCSNTTNFTPNSTYQSNLNLLLSSLTSNATSDIGFFYTTVGSQEPTAEVYGSFLCRGDLTPDLCKQCVATIAKDVVQKYCPSGKIAVLWYDECMLRYSNQSFWGKMDEAPRVSLWNVGNITEPTRFAQLLAETINGLVAPASNAPSGVQKYVTKEATFTKKYATKEATFTKKYATKEATFTKKYVTREAFTGFQKLYSLVQCTPDLSSTSCDRCLRGAIAQLPGCCTGKQGGRVLYPSCNIRYEVYPFYATEAATPPPPPGKFNEAATPPPPPGKSKLLSVVIASILASIVLSVLVVVVARCFIRKSRLIRAKRQKNKALNNDMTTVESLQFDLGTIEAATKKFSNDNKLGEGGFGQVFKGTLENGQEIAVKRLSKSSRQGVREFKNEVSLVAKLQHRNLVRLLGFCLEGEETILVYEYVPNKSLDYFLFEAKKREQLDWSTRYTIIGGIARGILYLHEESRLRVIHRDLKASNILLDVNMNPKISDFGMAKMFGVDDQTQGNTRRIVGTYGYMAPEYAMEGLYSVKSDVFSFGILLLEILTGRKNFLGYHATTSVPTLLNYAWELWNEGKVLELMDPLLKDSCSPNELLRYIHIGLLCVQENANDRPTMSSVVLMLKSESISLSKPERPAFYTGRRSTKDHDNTLGAPFSCSVNGLTISDDVPR
ncbi:hypothetical protein M0R45_013003 [Rubus argutus]|uniref:Cysteine-rich receptor-like protein kinase 25 n=1 Tax=Rubus argutus TaxID=59490 RepID=A0AAW1XGW6_RUBAR